MAGHVRIQTSIACRATIVPLRGRTAKTVEHRFELPLDVPILDTDRVPVVARFADTIGAIDHVGIASRTTSPWARTARISPRGLPAFEIAPLSHPQVLLARLTTSGSLARRFGAALDPVDEVPGLEAREFVASNHRAVVGWMEDRLREMFVVDGAFWTETCPPVYASGTIANLFHDKASVLSNADLREIGPERMGEEGMDALLESTATLPAGLTLARTILRSGMSTLSSETHDLTALLGDLAKASGLAASRPDLYDRRACRDIVEDLRRAAHGTMLAGTLETIGRSGIMERDIVLDAASEPEDAAAYGAGI